jgi:hypothetical protein
VESLRSVIFKNNKDRIPYFDIRYSLFDIRYLSASGGFAFSKFLFRFDWTLAASGAARMKHIVGTVNKLNVEHRTPNIERPIMMALSFSQFKQANSQ